MAAAIAYGFWVGRERPRAYFGLMLLPDRGGRRRLRRAGPPPLLRLLRGDADPALRPDRRLGRRRAARRDGQVRHLHDGGLAADAGRDHRLRLQQGTFDLVATATSDSTWIFLGFAVAFAIKAPLFPFHGWLPDAYRESSPEVAARALGRRSRRRRRTGSCGSRSRSSPGRRTTCATPILVLAAIGLVYGSLLAFRAPDIRGVIAYSIARADGADHDRPLRGQRPRLRRRRAADGQPRADLGGALPARRARSSGGPRTGELDRLGGMARGRPALATVLMTTGIIALAVPLLVGVRRRVPDPRRRLPAAAGAGRSSARSRSCSRRCTCCG